MKISLIITFFLLYKILLSYELTVMSIHQSKSITTNSKYKFTISEANGNWQDSEGNYGKSKILFYLENKNDGQASIRGLGELNDQNKNSIWFIPVRESDEDAGVGNIKFIDTNKLYSFLLNSSCTYAINYFENRSFLKVKCK